MWSYTLRVDTHLRSWFNVLVVLVASLAMAMALAPPSHGNGGLTMPLPMDCFLVVSSVGVDSTTEDTAVENEDVVAVEEDDAETTAEPTTSPAASTAPGPTSSRAALQALPSGSVVAVIPVEGMIYDFTLESLERRVQRAIDGGATVIVLELDTPGGVVTSAQDICRYLKNLPVPVIAWVNDQAYSAGTMIASACDAVVMSNSSAFGDSAPVAMGQELAPTERAKALSPVLAEYRDNARANGYDFAPFHAMCVLGIEVYFVEHVETGQRRLVNQTDFDIMVNGLSFEAAQDKHLRGGDPEDDYAKIARPTPTVSANEQSLWRAVETLPSGHTLPNGLVHDGSTLYTLNQTEAVDLGLAAAIVADEPALRKRLNAGSVVRVEQTWSESLAGFLTNPFVRGVLVLAVLVGAYVEFQAPGVGFPGAIAVIALIVLLVAPFVVGLAEVWHLIVMVLGLALLIVELVATPTFGLLGIVGIVMVIAGLALSVVPTDGSGKLPMPAPGTGDLLLRSSLSMLGAFALALVAMVALTQFYGKVPFLNRLILADDPRAGSGDPSRPTSPVHGDHALGGDRPAAVGQAATVTATGLRPSGRIEIDGHLIDAVSTGGFIDPGTAVRVVEVHGNRVVVDAEEA